VHFVRILCRFFLLLLLLLLLMMMMMMMRVEVVGREEQIPSLTH